MTDSSEPTRRGRRTGVRGDRGRALALAEPAPARLGHATLVAVGLADDYAVIDSPVGPLRVAWNGTRRVRRSRRAATTRAFEAGLPRPDRPPGDARRDAARRASPGPIDRRLAGDRRARIDLDLRGTTEFEQAVWLKALEIPRGEVRPYGWIAAEIGRPKAVRAVGTALGHNPIPLIVPCHRVVRSDGTIGQYSLGGPAQQADDPRRRGRRPGRPRGPGAGRDPLLRLGHDAHLLPADLPRRAAGHGAPPRALPLGRATRTRPAIAPCKPLPAGAGLAACLSRLPDQLDLAHASHGSPVVVHSRDTLDQPTMPTGPEHDRAPPRPRAMVWLAILILYVVWGSTYLGIRIAVESIPPFLMASSRFLLAGLIMLGAVAIVRRGALARARRASSCATRSSSGRCSWAAAWAPSPGASRPFRRASPRS